MRISSLRLSLIALAAAATLSVSAQRPKATLVNAKASWIGAMSDNGRWGISNTAGDTDSDNPQNKGGILIDLNNMTTTSVSGGTFGLASMDDVTDDGTIIAGSCDNVPAIWSRATGSWEKLPMPASYPYYTANTDTWSTKKPSVGELLCMTPDGHYAGGYISGNDIMVAYPVVYDLTTKTEVALTNLPKADMTGVYQNQNRVVGMSADGTKVLLRMSESYMTPAGMFAYIYDIPTQTWEPIGFTVTRTGKFIPINDHLHFIDGCVMSPSGNYVTGSAYMVYNNTVASGENWFPFTYNVETKELIIYEQLEDASGTAIDDNGVMYAASPNGSPYATAYVCYNGNFISYEQIFDQVYNYHIASDIGNDVVGSTHCVSGSGLIHAMYNGEGNGYLLRLQESLMDGASRVDLLAHYTANPPVGTAMTKIRSVDITFDRDIAYNGNYSSIKLLGPDGNALLSALSSTAISANDSKTLHVGLRTTTLQAGQQYTLLLPAGTVSLKSDATMKNKEIRITYTGRQEGAVLPTALYPEDGATIPVIDSGSNPVYMTFNAAIKLAENAPEVLFYEEGYDAPKAHFIASVSNGNLLTMYPTGAQYLFDGSNYRVEIPAGLVTDISGEGPNEAITLHYKGAYVRQINASDKYLFSSDCNVIYDFITFDGDQQQPNTDMQSLDFDNVTAWTGLRESFESDDWCFGSHSCYTPAGTSDDWMMIPQLFIPDDKAFLTFDAQSYRKSKKDVLTLYIYESESGYNSLNKELTTEIRANGTVLDRIELNPGASEENLSGDWQHFSYPLAQYSGKNIYIAFVNENTNQSVIFVDNVRVERDLNFLCSFRHGHTVVNQNELTIEGQLTIDSQNDTYSTVDMKLLDAKGNLVSQITESDLSLKRGDVYSFRFPEALPLEVGATNRFTVNITLDEVNTVVEEYVNDLTFEPTRRVLLEEYTGAGCGNCPQGIVMLEEFKNLFPGLVLPIALHLYQGDPLGQGVEAYGSNLGLNAAPSARINRLPDVYYPMVTVNGKYNKSGEGVVNEDGTPALTWLDVVRQEIANIPEASIDFAVNFNEANSQIEIPVSVRFALNTDKAVNVFAVVLEDGLMGVQQNYYSNLTDEALLPWSSGGTKAQPVVIVNYEDVARGLLTPFIGESGLLPTSFEAGKEYTTTIRGLLPSTIGDASKASVIVALTDGSSTSYRIINANKAAVGQSTLGVEGVNIDSAKSVSINAAGSVVTAVSPDGKRVALQVYALDGKLLASTTGNGAAIADLGGYRGLVVVRATAAGVANVQKVVIR